jgi:hypothetical protein
LWMFPSSDLEYIYRNTPSGSALRTYIVLFAVYCVAFDNLSDKLDNYPKEFLADVICKSIERGAVLGGCVKKEKWVSIFKERRCEMHDHTTSG